LFASEVNYWSGVVAQWQSVFLLDVRPWVWNTAQKKERKRERIMKKDEFC
jgi:hypothetical protein